MKNLIINFAPTGMVPTKSMTPHVPVTADEIVKCVEECYSYGVSMVHLHARDEKGNPTYKKEIYSKIIYGIREKMPDVIIVASTSGRIFRKFSERSEVLELRGDSKPDMASLTLGSMNFINNESINSPEMIRRLAYKMMDNGIKAELEIFDLGMINYCKYLISKELIQGPFYFNIFMGSINSLQPKYSHMASIVEDLPANSIISFAGLGKSQRLANAYGILNEDGIRIGLEDNIWMDSNKTIKATNLELVKRAVKLAKAYGREIASPDEVRRKLDLESKKPKQNI